VARDPTGDVEFVLERDRHPEQWRFVAVRYTIIGCNCCAAGFVGGAAWGVRYHHWSSRGVPRRYFVAGPQQIGRLGACKAAHGALGSVSG
jgi:hypothetical protein